jgi:hypothetical protein
MARSARTMLLAVTGNVDALDHSTFLGSRNSLPEGPRSGSGQASLLQPRPVPGATGPVCGVPTVAR